MDVKKIKNILKNEKGQGLIEFFLFLPFILMMYSICLSLASSLNSAINQQKVTRGYFYYKMSNNSMVPSPARGGGAEIPEQNNWTEFGMHINIWGEEFLQGSNSPKATCFKFEVPLGKSIDDSCDQSYSEFTTQYIRVSTAYGICGASFKRDGDGIKRYLTNGINPTGVINSTSCTITQ